MSAYCKIPKLAGLVAVLLVLIMLSGLPSLAVTVNETSVKAAVLTALDRKVAAWNRHDLNKVLDAYIDSPELTIFSSSGRMIMGHEALMLQYQKWFGAHPDSMGSIEVLDYKFSALGDHDALFTGHYALNEPDHPMNSGDFTLVFCFVPHHGWKILHEHLSRNSAS